MDNPNEHEVNFQGLKFCPVGIEDALKVVTRDIPGNREITSAL